MHKRYSDVDDKDKDKNAPQDHVLDLFCHVLAVVVFVDDGVQFEENTELPAPAPHCLQTQ